MAPRTKTCKANIASRNEPRELCDKPLANGMLAACEDHKTTLIPTGADGVYYRGGVYVAVWRHRGIQHKSFHAKFDEAREAKADHSGTARPALEIKDAFNTYALQWVDNYQGRTARGFDEDTRKAYKRALQLYAIPHFGSTPLRDIDRDGVDRLITNLQRQRLSAASIAKYLAPVRAMFSDLVERRKLSANPALSLKINAKAGRDPSGRGSKRATLLSRVELAAVLAAIPDQHRLVFETMAGTGCRISEVLGLDCTDLDNHGDQTTLRVERQWYRGTLKPNAKTEAAERTIELPPGLAAKLSARCAARSGPIFQTRTGKRLSDRNLARVLAAASTQSAVGGVSHHTFRHTHGSILLDEGWTIAEVSERLGHADPAITARVYTRKMADRRRDLSFLDPDPGIPNVGATTGLGNSWATPHPGMTAKGPRSPGATSAN